MPTERVLVVDDDSAILTLCQRILEADGFAVTIAKRGEDAWSKLENETFELLLTDIRLPGIDGLELIGRVRERAIDLVIITMTGYSNMEMAIQALSLGVDEFIIKPFMPDTLRVHVHRALEKSNLRNENSRLWMLLPLLRAPLSAISKNAEQLRQASTAENRTATNQIVENAERLERLVNDLSGAQFLPRGMPSLHLENCRVEQVVSELVEAYRPLALQKEQRLVTEVSSRVGAVMADRAILDLMFGSVLYSIIRLAPRETKIQIAAKGDAESVTLSVREQGSANAPEPKLLAPKGVYTNQVLAEPMSANGLSFIWTREFIRQHGGKIWRESEPNQRHIFHVMLPRQARVE